MAERIINLSQVNFDVDLPLVHFGEVEYAPGGRCGPRRQQDYQLIILYSGELKLHLDREIVRMKSGEARLLYPGQKEDFYFSDSARTRHAWCSVKPTAVPRRLRQLLDHPRASCQWTPPLQRLFELSRTSRSTSPSPLNTERSLHLALHLLVEFAHEAATQSIRPSDLRLLKLQAHISSEYALPHRLIELAQAAGVSRQHLLRLCRLRNLPSPLEQLYLRRLEVAADLLTHTGLSIKEVAEQSGFENPFHFSRKFRKWSGMSPRVYRHSC